MFSDAIVLETRRLLDEGQLSWRAIAERLDVSRSFVGNVAAGRRALQTMPIEEPHDSLASRCRECGGLVYKPCRLCRTRAYQRQVHRGRHVRRSHPSTGPRSRRVA
jgi:hypothetical protein